MDTNTFARDYRVLFAAMQPARSRLLADTRASAPGTALSAARTHRIGGSFPRGSVVGAPVMVMGGLRPKTGTRPSGRSLTTFDTYMIPTADGEPFRSRRLPV